ncbi:22070_t:CDS:1, partial [Gigaspora margarita]
LSQNPCKIRRWPDHWRPHLTAWIRFKGKIEVMGNWPWELTEIKIGKLEGQHFSVQKALKDLYESTHPMNNSIQNSSHFKWIKSKWSLNKKKDTFW